MVNNIKIALDAGHGVDTWNKATQTGSKGIGDFAEFDFNSAMVAKAKTLAEHNGFQVVLTQPLGGLDTPLTQRTNTAIAEHVQLCVSVHADANDDQNATGHYAFYWDSSERSKQFAQIWAKYSREIMQNPERGDAGTLASVLDTWTDFHMCRVPARAGLTAVLIEHAFFTNPHERELLKTDEFQWKCATTLVKAMCEFFGVAYTDLGAPLSWQQKDGLDAVAELAKDGLIKNPETWTADKMLQPAPTWLVMVLFSRAVSFLKKLLLLGK